MLRPDYISQLLREIESGRRRSATVLQKSCAICLGSIQALQGPIFLEEEEYISRSPSRRRKEFTAGRHAAHLAMEGLGLPPRPIVVDDLKSPIWPSGLTGSISHCNDFVASCVVKIDIFHAVGIDIEGGLHADEGISEIVLTQDERSMFLERVDVSIQVYTKMIFCAKEAIYKANWTLTKDFLDFKDINVSINNNLSHFTAKILKRSLGAKNYEKTVHGFFATGKDSVLAVAFPLSCSLPD